MLKIERLIRYCIDRYFQCPVECLRNDISYDTYVSKEIKYKEVFVRLNNLRRV
jgi:hypothetical protein